MMMRIPDHRSPTHPGEMLAEEFLGPLGISRMEAAQRMDVPLPQVDALVDGKQDITSDTAHRLARLLGTSPDFWLSGQRAWDLRREPR